MSYRPSFIHEFIKRLEAAHPPYSEIPRYDPHDASDRDLLVTNSQPQSFQLGTGASIFTDSLIPAIASARHEIIFVTCFWAPSHTLTALCDALSRLAAHRRAAIQDALERGAAAIPPLQVRICLSSRSLFQKLLHPQSPDGYVYPPSSWPKKLGLPDAALLEAGGIHLQVKSLFFLPFSVMHPKFAIIDRQRAFLPSCNVSWEPWLEGCVEVTGDAVQALLAFYSRTWDKSHASHPLPRVEGERPAFDFARAGLTVVPSAAHYRIEFQGQDPLPTLVLPSSCHRNPRFRPFPWQKAPTPPPTQLNVALLRLFEQARESIYIQTPNLTCEPVIAALLDCLARGVDVVIVTNRNMMLLEQLVTAGTTTAWFIRSFIRRFRRLKAAAGDGHEADRDVEAARPAIGHLRISYFHPKSLADSRSRDRRPLMGMSSQGEEPVHSHLKLTLVDQEYAVLGSGNQDRASWFTSQELGVLFHSPEFCARVKAGVDGVLEGRLELVFDSHGEK